MKYYALDIETSGLSVTSDYILEVCMIYDDGVSPISDLRCLNLVIERSDIRGNIRALLMHSANGLLTECLSGIHPTNLISMMSSFFEGYPTLAGKNISSFDLPFLHAHADRFREKMFPYHHRLLDVGSLWVTRADHCVPSLDECAARAGVDFVDRHRAKDGCLLTVELVRKALARS